MRVGPHPINNEEAAMGLVADILATKNSQVETIEPHATVLDAIKQMVEANVGSIVVVEGDAIRGIFTERDYLRRIVIEGRTSKTAQVREVMSVELVCTDPARSVDDCMAVMTQRRIRHLPVLDGGKLVGIVSIGDLVKSLSKEREIEIRYLTDYISGKYPG
jgi:CBS domain-containing protein